MESVGAESVGALNEAVATFSHSVKRRLLVWCARWALGFGIIALVVRFWPSMAWLWWVGAVAAALSLAFTLIVYLAIQRRVVVVRRHIAEAERLAEKLMQENAQAGDEA